MTFNNTEITTSQTYLEILREGVEKVWEKFKVQDYKKCLAGLETDRSGFNATTTLTLVFGDIQYGYCIQSAAYLYKVGQGDRYKDIALTLIDRTIEVFEAVVATGIKEYDLDTLQIVEVGFAGGPFIKGCILLKEAGMLDETRQKRLLPVGESMTRMSYRLPEWGGFNRCALHYMFFLRFATLFPESKEAAKAGKLGHMMAEESLGRWTIEDTAFYNGIWLSCMIEYLVETGKWNAKIEIIIRYYAAYYTHVQTPEGSMPDYGDARVREFGCTALMISFLEFAASKLNDGYVKYAAMKFMAFGKKFHEKTGGIYSLWMSRAYLVCADLLAENNVEPKLPFYESGEIMEDLVGKKMGFRSATDDTYLMLNYRDELNFARPAKMNMLHTIPAPAEKLHHGHADENSIAPYFYRGKYLLFDGGYRDRIDIDGHFRADFYHNRILLRNGRMFKEKGLLEYATDIGTYLPVTTEKIYYHTMPDMEVSRTRLSDPHHKAEWDRTVCHFVKGGFFAVIDSVRATERYEYTMGPIWHCGTVEKQGEADYLLRSTTPEHGGEPGTENLALRLAFVRKDLPIATESLRRCFVDGQQTVSQHLSDFLLQNEFVHFVNLLIPQDTAAEAKRADDIIASASCEVTGEGKCLTLTLTVDGKKYTIAHKMDIEKGVYDLKTKPSYCFEAGKATYGDFVTDALLGVFAEDDKTVDYAAVMLSRVDYKGKTVFAAPQIKFAKNDLTNATGAINYVKWMDVISK